MRDVRSRSFYCPKLGRTVTLVEYARCESGCDSICGILSCSDQEECAREADQGEGPVYPWGRCPACGSGDGEELLSGAGEG